MAGAEQLSRSILESDNLVVRPNNDLTSQMTGRKDRLSFLIQFINENGVLGKVGSIFFAICSFLTDWTGLNVYGS